MPGITLTLPSPFKGEGRVRVKMRVLPSSERNYKKSWGKL